jgi:hypothetical protein
MTSSKLPHVLSACAWALSSAVLSPLPVLAAANVPIVNTNGFETFSLTDLAGQQNWITDTDPPVRPGSAVVQQAVVHSGNKALQIDRVANSDKSWAIDVTSFNIHRFVVVDWDMRVTATGVENAIGPFFGVESHDLVPYNPGATLLGSLGVDATTGEVLYQATGSGALVASTKEVVFGGWHHYRLVYDFTLQKYSAFFDGANVVTTGFVDPGLNDFTHTGFSALAAAADGASQALTGTAYIDNFRVWDGIPEDFDNDLDVDGQDFSVWKGAYGSTSGADADGDLDSDGRDFLAWQRERGFVAPISAAAVPEPAGSILAALAALGLRACRRRS